MKTLKNQILMFFMAGIFIVLNSCSTSNAENKQSKVTAPVVTTTLEEKTEVIPTEVSAVKSELDKAHVAGKAAFVVVTGNGIAETSKAVTVAEGAKSIYKNAVVVQMNRDDAANADFVKEWRLTGAPLPLILVFSPKGTLTGGRILAQSTAENIAELIPSPKLEEVYAAISSNKNAIVVFTKKSFADRDEVVKNSKEAVALLKNEAVFVEVDMDDAKENGFMNQVRVNKATTKASVTLVVNKQGQVAGTSVTVPDPNKLVAAAKTPVKSGCGPGCGPAGCGQ
jgi:hypothetical protein